VSGGFYNYDNRFPILTKKASPKAGNHVDFQNILSKNIFILYKKENFFRKIFAFCTQMLYNY